MVIKRRIKLVSLCILLLSVCYSGVWLYVTMNAVRYLNSNFANQLLGSESYKISFTDAKIYGFPRAFGIKIAGIKEEYADGVVTHSAPLYVCYDLLSQAITTSYSGESIARAKPLSSGFGSKVTGEYSYVAPMPLSFKLIKIMLNADSKFELVNFIKALSFERKQIVARDLVDNAIVFDADLMYSALSASDKPYYYNFDELKNNIPKHYFAEDRGSNVKIEYLRKIAPVSVIYGALLGYSTSYDTTMELHTNSKTFDIMEIAKNTEFNIKSSGSYAGAEDTTSEAYGKFNIEDDNINIDGKYKFVSTPQAGYMELKLNQLKYIILTLLDNNAAAMIRPIVEPFLSNPEKFLPSGISTPKSISTTIDYTFKGQGKACDLNIKEFSIAVDGNGLNFNNISTLDEDFAWTTKGLLVVYGYKDILSTIIDYLDQLDPHEKDAVKLYKDSCAQFLNAISNHPGSTSNDVFIEYAGGVNEPQGKIGLNKYTVPQAVMMLKSILYYNATVIAKNSADFNAKIRSLLPEIAGHPEMLADIEAQTKVLDDKTKKIQGNDKSK